MMTEGNERLDRIERILEEVAARQQYHDEAFERFDSEMKLVKEAIAADAVPISCATPVAMPIITHTVRLNELR